MTERKIFRTLLSLEEARNRILKHFSPQPVGFEETPIWQALGRTTVEDIYSSIDVPGFDRASMDGYAVRASDTFEAEERKPVRLRIVGTIEAGDETEIEVRTGETAEISTGAPVPKGANAIVMVEHTQHEDDQVYVFRPVNPSENIMAAGSDLMTGELVLRKGERLTPREIGLLSAIGLERIKVCRRPKVAIISTGNELIPVGGNLSYGKIYDINANVIAGAVAECGGEVLLEGIAGDTIDDLKQKMKAGLEHADIVLTSGSTSAGKGDLLYRILDSYGSPGVIVHGLAVKPGKPTFAAIARGKPVFGLPGYPTSALTIFTLLVRPIINRMTGRQEDEKEERIAAKCASRIYSAKGRREFLPVHLIKDEIGSFLVYPTTEGSGAITSLAMADGFIEIPEETQFLEEGERVSVQLFSQTPILPDLMIIGSHCVGLDILLECIRRSDPSFHSKIINTGSVGGFNAVKRGEADVAGIHLLDETAGKYNLPFLKKYGIQDSAVLIKGYVRQQGLIVAKGNPKGINRIEDLLTGDVSFMNRNRGSGTRLLFDLCMKRIANERKTTSEKLAFKVKGYETETKSHSAVAAAVSHGKVDAGLGIRTAAEMYGLGFVPIAEEHYDFLVLRKRLEKESVKKFLETLRSVEFKTELQRKAPGLIPSEETGTILS